MTPLEQLLATWREQDAELLERSSPMTLALAHFAQSRTDELAAALAVQTEGKDDIRPLLRQCLTLLTNTAGFDQRASAEWMSIRNDAVHRIDALLSSDTRTPQAPSGGVESFDAMVQVLKDACDRSWSDETPYQVAVIAANAIYWRQQEIEKLRTPDGAQANRGSDGIPAAVTVIPLSPELQAALDQAETTQEPKP